VLDAQYFGVAQRRRRVFVVGCAGDWRSAAKVLFESESLRRDSAPSRKAWEGFAKVAGTLTSNGGGLNRPAGNANELDFCIPAYGIAGNWIGRKPENGGNATEPMLDIAPCLTKTDRHAVGQPMPINTMVALRHKALGKGTGFGLSDEGSPAYTITKGHSHAVAQPIIVHGTQDPCTSDIAFAQGRNNGGENVLIKSMAVRRLTPKECERLQGFPDGYTDIKPNGKDTPDGHRYKALGNSMAVPVMAWIGKRIQEVENS